MARSRGLGLGYIPKKSPVHRLTGAAKLLMVVLVCLAAMITYDTRFLLAVIVGSSIMFAVSRVPLRDMKVILTLLCIFMILNNLFIFLFSPEEGVDIYGTRHFITHLFGNYNLVQEQLFYQLNVTMKYFSIIPLALIFFVTTEPSEFASSLNKVGVNYKAAYSVSLALRYIPTLQREYVEISQAQQARGADISKGAKLGRRIKGLISIVFPLIVTSIDKIETISYAMELRSFGKNKRRTWYRARAFAPADYIVVIVSASLIAVSVMLNIANGGRFFNPFI
jgi:energy-coupling factor transport system permease protein